MTSSSQKETSLPCQQKLDKARAQLLMKQPFFGNLLLSLRMVKRDDLPTKTMGVDGVNIYYDEDFVNTLNLKELKGVLIHEIMHVAMCHLTRKKKFHDVKKWNYACDYAINPIISKMTDVVLPKNALLERQFYDMSAEQIYKALPPMEEVEDQTQGAFRDDHLDMDEVDEQKFVKRMINVWDNMTDAEKERGDVPADIARIIKDLKKPQFDWRKYIRASVSTIFLRSDYNSSRKSFVYQSICGDDAFFPKLMGEENKTLAVVVDTSGSISQEQIISFASEIEGVAKLADKTIILTCDASVHEEVEITQFSDIMQSLKFSGGGGTNFGPAFDHLREKNIRPECLVFLTDGFGMFPKEAPNYPVIWCLTSSHLENTQFPFGECLEMKDFGTD